MRTHPVRYLFDHIDPPQAHAWHQLTYAAAGQLEIETAELRALVPPDCAIWVPAGTEHRERMRAPVSVRTLYLAPGALKRPPLACRTVSVPPLLRELILHITTLGALDRSVPPERRLIGVLMDLLDSLVDVPMQLPTPRDPRARKLAELLEREPGARVPIAELARRAGASVRTLERLFVAETGLSTGEWRRRFRLFHALSLLESGTSVTEVAFEVGYANVSAFCAAFRRQFGRAPRQPRQPA